MRHCHPPSSQATSEAKPEANANRTTPPSPHYTRRTPKQTAHLGSGHGVPDLHETVIRPADDTLTIRGKIDAHHAAVVPRQRANLPPKPHLRPRPMRKLPSTPALNHPHHTTTMNAITQSCSPRLPSRRPRFLRGGPTTCWRCTSRRGRQRLCTPSPCDPPACATANHSHLRPLAKRN